MLKVADYVLRAKEALGNPHMSDRELGKLLGGFASSTISGARYGNMSDPLALKLAEVLPTIEAGEILWVARVEREKDPAVKAALRSYVGKILSTMPSKAMARGALSGVVVAVALSGAPSPSQASTPAASDNPPRLCIM